MLDYIKIIIVDTLQINEVWNHSDLIYHSEHTYLNKSDGTLKKVGKKSYLNLNFTRYENRLEIDGSLHKLFNTGLHNANDFTVTDCINTINKFCMQFGVDPELCNVIGLEFGINVTAPNNVSDLVKWLRFHHRKQFVKFPKLEQCYFAGTDYFGVKAYNKTLQFPQYAEPNIFRFEGKTRQSKYLVLKGIKTLKDLTDPTIFRLLSDVILAEWGNVLIFDKRTKKGVKFCNTDFWLEILESNHRNTFIKSKKRYYKLLGRNGLQNLIYTVIDEKLKLLNECANSTISELGKLIKPETTNGVKPQKIGVHIPTIVKVENNRQPEPTVYRICLVTGLDISMQKKDSVFLCIAGLKYYRENEPAKYNLVERQYLTKKTKPLKWEEQLYYISHNIRNAYTNKIHNQKSFEKRNYSPNQLQFNFRT
ncbi:hypothetical protein JET18_00875 [Chryseobacterium sp. L7]|uniref:Uncharacterized protein n=1 Tax=Chryseobacterium endalhagicum TaxID=2797638 RepID=A0ABS1Q9U6_9FLAO|nr:hypothetical protein [Chryseobacterium endalhagicum]MBL1219375.1 hypothetical protein [Chryseobacterium endalhagicum]